MSNSITFKLLLAAVCALALLAVSALADGSASVTATPSTICSVSVSELAQCLPAITGKSPPRPTKECCGVMKKANLRCLCNYKAQFANFGIDPAKAMALPKKCGRNLPRQC
ncbi:putative lipid-transfer protein DIR1 [Salvia divinorum]|uniref:Lipid-transfer protein DIR1 n=1 Tax=Salvia divinorum TaxID=28513 RepID=A0ABD1IE52_SALDI